MKESLIKPPKSVRVPRIRLNIRKDRLFKLKGYPFVLIGLAAGLLSLFLASGCSMFGMVERGEYNELSGRVTNLEDIVVHDRLAGPPGGAGGAYSGLPAAYSPPPPSYGGSSSSSSAAAPTAGDYSLAGLPTITDPASPIYYGPAAATPAAGAADPRASGNERNRYNRAMALLKGKRYDDAAAAFRAILADFPGGRLSPNARYWLGECHYAKGDFSSALQEFQRGFYDYPQSNKAPDYLLKAAYSQSRLGDGPGAMESLRVLLERYPSSNSANMVKSGRSRFP
jgi:tol-pal system protein YbgF